MCLHETYKPTFFSWFFKRSCSSFFSFSSCSTCLAMMKSGSNSSRSYREKQRNRSTHTRKPVYNLFHLPLNVKPKSNQDNLSKLCRLDLRNAHHPPFHIPESALRTSMSMSLNALAPSSVFLICSRRSRTVFFLICSCSCMMRSFSLSLASWRRRSSSALRTFWSSASRCSSSSFSRWMFRLSRRSLRSSMVWRRARMRWCSLRAFLR